MKKILQFALLIVLTTLFSCEKEDQKLQKEIVNGVSDSQAFREGKFKKEIIISDASGSNQAFYAIYSDDEKLLNDFLESNQLSLITNDGKNQIFNSSDLFSDQQSIFKTSENFNLEQEPKIIIDLVSTNLLENVSSFLLEVEPNEIKSTNDFIFGYPVGYTTQNDFIGAVHRGNGYEFVAKLRYKKNRLSQWHDLEINGANSWFIYPSGAYYCALDEDNDLFKRGIVIYPHQYQSGVNYHIAYEHEDFRSRICEIGTYDFNNYGECYVGTAPEGTSAFIYGPNSHNLSFYYTPKNGNQCPLAGSYFDGANCFVMSIPSTCEPYTWQRNWLVKSNKI